MIDGGDATVLSKWGGCRYFLVMIDAKTAYTVIYYMRDNSARSFVNALLYLERLVKVMCNGTEIKSIYGDFFSTHLDRNVFGALRADKGWEIEVTPPYCHWLNPYCEGSMRLLKAETRPRLRALIGQNIEGTPLSDASKYWDLSMENARQDSDVRPVRTLERDQAIALAPECVWRGDANYIPNMSSYHPFGAVCHILIQPQHRSNPFTDTLEMAWFMFTADYNPFVHAGTTSPQSGVFLKTGNRLQVSGRVVHTYRDMIPKRVRSIVESSETSAETANDASVVSVPFAPVRFSQPATPPVVDEPHRRSNAYWRTARDPEDSDTKRSIVESHPPDPPSSTPTPTIDPPSEPIDEPIAPLSPVHPPAPPMPSSTERRKSFGLKSTPSSSTSMSPSIAVAPSDSLLRRSSRVSVPPPALPKGTVHADGACKPGIKKLQASKVAPTSSQTPARQTASVRPPPEPPPDTSSRRPNLSNSIYEFGSPHMSDLARATMKGRMQRDGTYNDPLGRLEPGGSYDKHPPTPPVPAILCSRATTMRAAWQTRACDPRLRKSTPISPRQSAWLWRSV